MTNTKIKKESKILKKNENIRAKQRKVRRLHLSNSADSLNKRGEGALQAIMPDAAQILQTRTCKKVRRISRKRNRGTTKTTRGQTIRRRKKDTQTRRESKLRRRKSKRGKRKRTVKPKTRRRV